MKQSLQLTTSLKTTMTPQLRMALKVLQCTSIELSNEIQAHVDSNPMLEFESDYNNEPSSDLTDFSAPEEASSSESQEQWEKDIPEQLSVDSGWDDHYSNATATSSSSSDFDPLLNQTADTSLQSHLSEQLDLCGFSETDRMIADYIVDSLDLNGWLADLPENLIAAINDNESLEEDVELDEFVAVLHRIQQLEPAGIAATDLKECLLLQLRASPENELKPLALQLVEYMMPLLVGHEFNKLKKRLRCDDETLNSVIRLIQALDPHPGLQYNNALIEYVTPEVIVTQAEEGWKVQINPEVAPKLTINRDYANLVERGVNTDQNKYLKQNLQDAQWFIKSIENRFDTLFNVANTIVIKQVDFFENGPQFMRPMILADVAKALDLHESTISRATTGKYMMTPQGIFELKYFFSSHVSSESGDTSSTAIKAIIKQLVDKEPPQKPLSDAKLVKLLADEGVDVARRTVAKYREALGIPSSSQRKRLK